MSDTEGGLQRETAGITTHLIITFVRDQLGPASVDDLLARVGSAPVEVTPDHPPR